MFVKLGAAATIIKSSADPAAGSRMSFRDYNYLEITMRSSPGTSDNSVCIDTGCGMSCIDKGFFIKHFPNIKTSQVTPIEIHGMGTKNTQSSDYALLTVYFPGYITDRKSQVLVEITREFHIVE